MAVASEIEARADFSKVRYAQCWEDADILLKALKVGESDVVLSIASAGDNSLSLLSQRPKAVFALDLNETQLFCLEARKAAYLSLDHAALLELMGSRPSKRRDVLWTEVASGLSTRAQDFFEGQKALIGRWGLGGIGKFEHYFSLFRRFILPLMHSKATIEALMTAQSDEDRAAFFHNRFANWRYKFLTRAFFSRTVMGWLGRDPAFFAYVNEPFSEHIKRRIEHGLANLDPSENPYLSWILFGQHRNTLPHALRLENFETIRQNLDRLHAFSLSTEAFAQKLKEASGDDNSKKQELLSALKISRFNLSNIFEYMSEDNFKAMFEGLLDMATPDARFAYWNMMVPRRASQHFSELIYDQPLSSSLYAEDKAIFYRDFVVEQRGGL